MNITNSPEPETNSLEPEVIVLLGGTFDPIHLGHTLPAIETAQWLGAEKVNLIPTHIPPHKNRPHANAQQRVAMVKLICNNNPLFQLDTRELQRDKLSYTIDTLLELKKELPNSQLYFVMGMDSLQSFTHWERWQQILNLCNIVVNIRPGYADIKQIENIIDPALKSYIVHDLIEVKKYSSGKIILHECTPFNISSSQIREKIKTGKSYHTLVSLPVHEYIEHHQLYR